MASSQFLRLSVKGGDRFEWTGNVQDLDKLFTALNYTGTWSQPTGKGNPHKFTNEEFTCTWFASKNSLLIQGKKSKGLIDKLKHVLDYPISLNAAKDECKQSAEIACKDEEAARASASQIASTKECKNDCKALPEVKEEIDFNEAAFHDGLNPGKSITNLIQFKTRKWVREGARITITTPFLDTAGMQFILSCIRNENALDKIYTREVCGWNNKKIDRLIAESQLPGHWVVSKMVAIKKAPSFHAKFVAGEYKDKVEIILTSCNFTSEHVFSDQLETVMRLESSVEVFHSDWLRPLEIMAEKEGNMAKFLNMDDVMQEVINIEQ